ncbi:MAG: cellulase family glycosylhydrolase [Bacilli bacterium]
MKDNRILLIPSLFTLLVSLIVPSKANEDIVDSSSNLSNGNNYNSSDEFVTIKDGKFNYQNSEFRFIGSNNYYLHYKDEIMVEDAISSAAKGGFNVLRTWGFFDGVDDDYNNNHAYMQPYANSYEAPKTAPDYYVNCWERMDYALNVAKEEGVKLIIVFTNYWSDFGGITQYVKWSDANSGIDITDKNYSPDLSKFYEDSFCKETFKNYMNYFVNRVNTVNGVTYKDDPTIMGFELMNEPRNPGKDVSIVTNWANEMTTYLRSIDSNHLIALGDEGYFSNRESDAYNGQSKDSYNGNQGVSYEDIIALPNIDFGTYHLYPEGWGAPEVAEAWGKKWIKDHIEATDKVNKPCILEEFGINTQNKQNRELIYSSWCQQIYDLNGAGALFWMIAGKDTGDSSDNGYYPDYDGYRLLWKGESKSSEEIIALHNYATMFTYGADFVTFEDKIFFIAPYKTVADYTSDGPVEIDSDTTPIYRSKISVRSDKTVKRVAIYTNYVYAGEMIYDSDSNYYYFDIEMKYYLRGNKISIYVKSYFDDGTTLESDMGFIQRQLKYSMVLDKTYEFNSSDSEAPTLYNYGNCAVKSFTGVNLSDFNGGSYKITCNSKESTYWSELKIGVKGLGSVITDHNEVDYDVYFQKDLCIPYDGKIPSGAEATENSYGFRNYAALDPSWTKLCLNENNIKATDCEVVAIDGVDYYKQTVKIPYSADDTQTLLVLGIVFNYLGYEGDLYIDNLKFYNKVDEGTATDGYEERPELVEPSDDTNTDTNNSSINLPLVISLSVIGVAVITTIIILVRNKILKKKPIK